MFDSGFEGTAQQGMEGMAKQLQGSERAWWDVPCMSQTRRQEMMDPKQKIVSSSRLGLVTDFLQLHPIS